MSLPLWGFAATAVLAVVLLISYPWEFLSIVSIIYLALIPVSMRAHRRLAAADEARAVVTPPPAGGGLPPQPIEARHQDHQNSDETPPHPHLAPSLIHARNIGRARRKIKE